MRNAELTNELDDLFLSAARICHHGNSALRRRDRRRNVAGLLKNGADDQQIRPLCLGNRASLARPSGQPQLVKRLVAEIASMASKIRIGSNLLAAKQTDNASLRALLEERFCGFHNC